MSNSDNSSPVRRRSPISVEDCGAAAAADIIADRWTFLIIREALYGVQRYDDMREDLSIPRSVLTDRLKKLVAHGVLQKEPYREDGARTRHAYALTETGRALAMTFVALMQWGDAFIKPGEPSLDVRETATGAPIRVAFVREGQESVPLDEIAFQPKQKK